MSWISENYEKAALGAAVLAAAGLAYAGWSKLGSIDLNFGSAAKGPPTKSDPGVKSADMVARTQSSFQLKREWIKGENEDRSVDLFTGIALFVNKNELEKPVDLIEGKDVHSGIPNSWWLQNRIDPGFGDSPLRDEDGDGFTNAEEYSANTDPTNTKEYPSLVTKLTYIGAESVQWVLRPGFEGAGGSFTFTYGDGKSANRVGATNPVLPGATFFEKGPAAGRFKLLSSEKRRVMNDAIKAEEEITFVKIEDLKPNKKGTVYEIPASFRTTEQLKHSRFDYTAVLSLEAVGLSGQEFKIEENTDFALPISEGKKPYRMKKVTPELIVIEFTGEDGKIQTYEIMKGATGPASSVNP
jgi:hypothetical protein